MTIRLQKIRQETLRLNCEGAICTINQARGFESEHHQDLVALYSFESPSGSIERQRFKPPRLYALAKR